MTNFAIDRKLRNELTKTNHELFTHMHTTLKSLLQVTKKMLTISSAVINARGGFFEDERKYEFALIKIIVIL